MAQAQRPYFVFRRNGRVHLNWRGRQFSQQLVAEVCALADTPCSEVVWRVLATHSFRQYPLQFPSRASPCAITFQLESKAWKGLLSAKSPKGRPTQPAAVPATQLRCKRRLSDRKTSFNAVIVAAEIGHRCDFVNLRVQKFSKSLRRSVTVLPVGGLARSVKRLAT